MIAFVFAVFTLYGCGAEAVLYGLMMLVLGIPVYVWQRRRTSRCRSQYGLRTMYRAVSPYDFSLPAMMSLLTSSNPKLVQCRCEL